jgi:hypothetical protein
MSDKKIMIKTYKLKELKEKANKYDKLINQIKNDLNYIDTEYIIDKCEEKINFNIKCELEDLLNGVDEY